MSEAETLAEIYDEADALVICIAHKGDSYVDGTDNYSRRSLEANLDNVYTDYKLYIMECWKGDIGSKTLTVPIPGGDFGSYIVDFDLPELEHDSSAPICFLPLKADGDRYVPILTGGVALGDYWDMNGDAVMDTVEDDAKLLTPMCETAMFDGITSMQELISALDALTPAIAEADTE